MSGEAGLWTVLAIGVLLLAWYVAGNELMRRRASSLAVWCRKAFTPASSELTIQWLTVNSFRIEAKEPRDPFRSASITGLVESLDVLVIWAWNRTRGRRDMVLLQCELRQPVVADVELYRPRSLLAGDARHLSRQMAWPEEPLDEFFLAPAGARSRALAHRLLSELGAERSKLIRLALRRNDSRLTLALNLPDVSRLDPEYIYRTASLLAIEATRSNLPAG